MPTPYVVEMFLDRIAACRVYQKDAYTQASPWLYHKKSRQYHVMEEESFQLLERLLKMLAVRGEAETFRYVRKILREDKRRRFAAFCRRNFGKP